MFIWTAYSLNFLPACPTARLPAQQNLEDSRKRLEEIRKEREQLQADRERLQGQVHDLNEELDNIERQRQTTNRLVNELEVQIGGLNNQLDRMSAELILAQDNLEEKRAILARRLAEIYKRGTLYNFEVMVAAESFGDLLNRYKYLYLTSRQDKALVGDVERLRDLVQRQRKALVDARSQLGRTQDEHEAELARYGALAQERAKRLREARRSSKATDERLSALERDEGHLNDLIARLDAIRKENDARGALTGVRTPGSITTSDIGKLDWPVEGRILYSFGKDTLPSGGIIKHNGIAIATAVGTPVKAVEAGKITWTQPIGTYGLSVLLDHGNGYYSFYSHLETATVKPGASVTRGQVIGTVGGANSDEGPHLYFEIRGGSGVALDPAEWLKKRR